MVGYICDSCISIDKFYTVFHMYLSGNHSSGKETYDFWEMIYVIDGELSTTVGSNVYKLGCGSLILYEPAELHTLSVDSGKHAEIFILTFSMNGSAVSRLRSAPFTLTEELKADMRRIIDFCNTNSTAALIDNFYRAHHSFLFSQPLLMSKVCVMTELLLLSLCDASPNKNSRVNTRDAILFSVVTDSMREKKDSFLTIEELSEMHSVSPTKLKTLIKKYTGMPIHQYYIRLKLSQAPELFRSGFNISEVSRELGFCNSNYFSYVFKRENGETPSQYLNKLKEVPH